jgi:uncharacterized protein YggT (Ycf19 family)
MESQTGLYRVTRIIWYIFYVIEVMLLFRVLLRLLGANASAGFTQLVYGVSMPLLAPFRFVFSTPSVGGSVFEWSTLLAMIVYWVIAWGIVKLLAMNRSVSEGEAQHTLTEEDKA